MIPLNDTDKPHTYAYVAGCRNALWISGIVREIDHEGRKIMISRTDEDEMMPIYLAPGDYIPDDIRVSESAKLICHVYSGVQDDDDPDVKASRHSRLVAKYVGRPTHLDERISISPKEIMEPSEELLTSFDIPARASALSNSVQLAGFIDGAPMLIRDTENDRARVVFMLRQASGAKHLIPIEIAGKHAPQYHRHLKVSMPVYIDGVALPAKRTDNGESVTLIRSTHVRKALPEKDFMFNTLPEWAIDMRRRFIAGMQQQQAKRAAAAAAREAEELGLDEVEDEEE